MELQPILQNELVFLRPLEESDYEPLFAIAKDPLIWQQHPCCDRYKKEVFYEFFLDSLNSKGALIVISKLDRKVIGSTRYSLTNSDAHTIEIGWSFLSRDYWGGEYNKSIKGLMINHAFTMVEYVVFYIGKNNIRSQKAVEKIGGRKILTPRLRHLRRTGSKEWTYLIIKNDWLTASR